MTPLRDQGYRDWLREECRCVVCVKFGLLNGILEWFHRITDAAHTVNNGRGSKGPDSSCIPLCRRHHDEMEAFAQKYSLDLEQEAAAHYAAWLIVQGGNGGMKLNLGAADRHMEGFVSVDIAPPADQIVDLAGPWPWPDSSIEEVLALDVCEHIGDAGLCGVCARPVSTDGSMCVRHPLGRIHFMNQLHRVLEPNGRATIETPNAARGCGFYQDPTHVSPWCMSTFRYFQAGSFAHRRLAKLYGITAAFRIVSLTERETPGEFAPETAWKMTAILEAVK